MRTDTDTDICIQINYACEVWGFHTALDIERVHLNFCKRVLGVKRTTQNDFVYGILGRVPMNIIRHIRIVKYWLSIVSGKKSQIVSIVYDGTLSSLYNANVVNCASNVRDLLCTIGYGDIWVNQGATDPDGFLAAFKCRLHDVYSQQWSSGVVDYMFSQGPVSTEKLYQIAYLATFWSQ